MKKKKSIREDYIEKGYIVPAEKPSSERLARQGYPFAAAALYDWEQHLSRFHG